MAFCENGFVFPISFAGYENKSKNFIQEKILPAVCALLNCYGGTVEVSEANLLIKSLEQKIMNILGVSSYYRYITIKAIESAQDKHNILIHVKKSDTLITVNYSLYLPTEKQVAVVAATDRIDVIQRVLQRSIVEDCVTNRSHFNSFVLGKDSRLRESTVCQLKSLKTQASPSKKTKFADRMVSENNKISHYLSAFANNMGGHIYYGIDDNGFVTGEQLEEDDKVDAIKKVTKEVNKLIWTECRLTPKRGLHWEIFFEKVTDANGDLDNTTYVVVIFVACCCGGVFTREPESYYIEERKVKEMEYDLWWRAFKAGAFSRVDRFTWSSRNNVNRISWSSETNKNFFIKLSEKLVDHRDAGDGEGFDKLCKLAVQPKFKERNAHLVVKAGEITIAYKSGNAINATNLLTEFESLLSSSIDKTIFEVRLRLSQSLVARSVHDYEESYAKSTDGLQLAQLIPPGLCLLWLYLECAMNAICLGSKNQDNAAVYNEKKREALVYLDEAARVANTLAQENIPFRITDFNHKRCIYRAWVLINYSVTGVAAEIAPTREDLDAAADELSSAFNNKLKGKPLSKFREIEYDLVQCDHLTRLSELLEDGVEKTQTLEDALKLACSAEKLAKENAKFKNLYEYAKKRRICLNELLDKPHENCERTFEGVEY